MLSTFRVVACIFKFNFLFAYYLLCVNSTVFFCYWQLIAELCQTMPTMLIAHHVMRFQTELNFSIICNVLCIQIYRWYTRVSRKNSSIFSTLDGNCKNWIFRWVRNYIKRRTYGRRAFICLFYKEQRKTYPKEWFET